MPHLLRWRRVVGSRIAVGGSELPFGRRRRIALAAAGAPSDGVGGWIGAVHDCHVHVTSPGPSHARTHVVVHASPPGQPVDDPVRLSGALSGSPTPATQTKIRRIPKDNPADFRRDLRSIGLLPTPGSTSPALH